MAALLGLILVICGLCHWLLEPLLGLLSSVLTLAGLPALLLVGALWLLAGRPSRF